MIKENLDTNKTSTYFNSYQEFSNYLHCLENTPHLSSQIHFKCLTYNSVSKKIVAKLFDNVYGVILLLVDIYHTTISN